MLPSEKLKDPMRPRISQSLRIRLPNQTLKNIQFASLRLPNFNKNLTEYNEPVQTSNLCQRDVAKPKLDYPLNNRLSLPLEFASKRSSLPCRKNGIRNLEIDSIWWPDGEPTSRNLDILYDESRQVPSNRIYSNSGTLKQNHRKSTLGRIKNWGKRSKTSLENKYLRPSNGENWEKSMSIEGLSITPYDSSSSSSLSSSLPSIEILNSAFSLPSAPTNLTVKQVKRRKIVKTLIKSENTYVNSLRRLLEDYKLPLEKRRILVKYKVEIIFQNIEEIYEYHLLVRKNLLEAAKNWDKKERLGDTFASLFSKSEVVELYSNFINNYTRATDCARKESFKNAAFRNFLKDRELMNEDKLSLYDLMIRIIQRFPRYALLIQDLLNETPEDHPDEVSLKLALKTVSFVGDLLNERKRESDQNETITERIKRISNKDIKPIRASILGSTRSSLSSAYKISTGIPSYLIENSPFSMTFDYSRKTQSDKNETEKCR